MSIAGWNFSFCFKKEIIISDWEEEEEEEEEEEGVLSVNCIEIGSVLPEETTISGKFYSSIFVSCWKLKSEGIFHPRTGHEGPEGQ
jgi:hypothetical protein